MTLAVTFKAECPKGHVFVLPGWVAALLSRGCLSASEEEAILSCAREGRIGLLRYEPDLQVKAGVGEEAPRLDE